MAQRPMQIWEFATTAERDGTGTDDGLEAGDVSYVVASNAWFYAATVAAGSSTWTAVTAGSGTTLAATLAAGNTTGGTDLEVTAGDSFTLNENATVPGGAPAAGEGKLWVRSDAPNVLVFTDDAGTDHVLGTGSGSGDVTGPGSSTDDALARFDSTTGKVIQNSVGVLSDAGDLSGLNDITLAGTVDGRDVAADGTTLDNHVADTSNPHTTTLALALSSGSTTGGTGPEISAGDPVTLNENASVPGGAPAAGKGKIWVRNDSPNVLIFTDDAGTDIDLTSGGSTPTLSQVLGAGSSTGGDDLTVTTGDSVVFPLTSGSNVNLTESSGFSIATDGGADDVVIDTSAGTGAINLTPGGDLVLDYATWPASDGSASQVLRTDGAGNLSWASGSQGLDSVLVVGNETGGTDIVVTSGDAIAAADGSSSAGADLSLSGGDADGAGNAGGNATVVGGAGVGGGAGGVTFVQGGTGGATGGGGDVSIISGTAGGSGGDAGDITLSSGSSSAGDIGVVHVANTALQFTEQSAVPGPSIVATQGRVWVKDDAPNTLWFTDDAGTDFQVGGSGAPGSTLAATLSAGNTTGGTDIVVSSGDEINSSDGSSSDGANLILRPGDADGAGNSAGELQLQAGVSSSDADGAPTRIFSGNSGGDAGTDGGLLILAPGVGSSTGVGGNGGDLYLQSGSGGGTAGRTGHVFLYTPVNTGSATESGDIYVYQQERCPQANAVLHRTARTTISPGSSPATMAVAYSLTSNETAVILRGDVTGIGQADGDDLVRATFEGTWYRSGGTVTAGVTSVTSQGINGALTDDPAWSVSVDISGDDVRIRVTSADTGGTNQNIIYVGNWTAQLVS